METLSQPACLEDAVRIFKEKEGFTPGDIRGADNGFYFRTLYTARGNYCVTFKRDYYHEFSRHFPNEGEDDPGITANIKLLQACARNHVKFVAVMGDGSVRIIQPERFLLYAANHNLRVPHLQGEVACPERMFSSI